MRVCCVWRYSNVCYVSALEVKSRMINYAGKVFNPNI